MKVTDVDIIASNPSNVIGLSFQDYTSQNPFNVKTILGLDADEIIPKFYGHSGLNAEKYYELSMMRRDIVVQVELNPDYSQSQSPATLRDELYRMIASSRTGLVTLEFKNSSTVVAAISGFVTKVETAQFSKKQEVHITISCEDALLKAASEIEIPVETLDPQNTIVNDTLSTAPHGFRFGVKFTDGIIDFSIQDLDTPNWAFEVNLTGSPLESFIEDDELHFSSEKNNRYLYLVRDLEIIHLIDRILPTSVWPVLFPGENPFILSPSNNWDYITHYPTYWGI